MTEVTVYLARHAEAANPKGILYGRLPRVGLSPTGRTQASLLAEAMAELPLEAIYYSPLLRARQTASAVARHHPGTSLIRSSLLLENLHPYQGRPQAEVARLGDRVYDADVLAGIGESIADLSDRLMRFVRRAARRHPGGVVAAVAHADPIAALRAHLLGRDMTPASLRAEAPPTASVFRVLWSDGDSPRLEWFWKAPPPATRKSQDAESVPVALKRGTPPSHVPGPSLIGSLVELLAIVIVRLRVSLTVPGALSARGTSSA